MDFKEIFKIKVYSTLVSEHLTKEMKSINLSNIPLFISREFL